MISLCVLLVAALVASSAARRSSSSSSESSTDNNEDRKAFVADNVANFEARLNTAVSKALLNKNLINELNNGQGSETLDQFVRPFLKTYGVKSERDFEKTFELVNALNKRKRNAFILADAGDSDSSSSSSSSSSDSSDDSNRAQDAVDQFLASFDDQDNKDAFRLAVLKEALVQHLRHGRESDADVKEVSNLLQGFDDWKAVNKDILKNERAAKKLLGDVPVFGSNKKQKLSKQHQDLFTTSSDK